MINENRNKLLNFYSYYKKNDFIYLEMLLDNFKNELEHNKQELQFQLQEIENNLQLLENIKKDIYNKEIKKEKEGEKKENGK